MLLTGGIAPAGVRVTRDEWSYYLAFGRRDRLVLDSMAVEEAAEIERIEFEDGTIWTAADVAARVELLPATEASDALWGTAGSDVLAGLGGDDLLYGHGGHDLLIGGDGNDYYSFAAGDGADRIDNFDANLDSWDWIRLADAASGDALLAKSGADLVLHLGGGDRVTLIGWYDGEQRKIDAVFFEGDGAFWDAAVLEQLAPVGGNSTPQLSNPVENQAVDEGSEFSFLVPVDTFVDPDVDDTLTYSASFAEGWLSFDAQSRTFSGTPTSADVGEVEVTLTATDVSGESASDTFHIQVLNANEAPVANDDAAALAEDGAASVTGNVLANDTDADAGTVLTLANPGVYAATYGSLTIETDGRYVYAVDNAAVQWLAAGQSESDTFAYVVADDDAAPLIAEGRLVVSIAGVNDVPTLTGAIPDQRGGEGLQFGFALPAGTFADVDGGDSLALSATLADGSALPGWLSFEDGEFRGTPGLADGGEYLIRVTATDKADTRAATNFSLAVSDSLASGDSLIGTRRGDVLNGTDAAELLDGGDGADQLLAGGGDDILRYFADDRARGKNRYARFFPRRRGLRCAFRNRRT